MKKRLWLLSVFAVTGALVGAGCTERVYVQQPAPVASSEPPPSGPQVPPPTMEPSAPQPAPQADVLVAAPGPGYVWTAGYYDWNGAAWLWLPGRWLRPPHPGAVWWGGHWDRRHGRRVWVRGRWR
ncbi:MAG TPA: YXWGXW repeat-containing protein [Verrucomicrobiae bacterium]|nr:YXWGXW repeat-containing protein [Verrucomicrobiae bacterium]